MRLVIPIALACLMVAGCLGPSGRDLGALDTPAEVVVSMKDLKYLPLVIEVAPGTKVTWVNDDPFAHTVTPVDKAAWGSEGSGDARADWVGAGESWSFTFTKEGEYDYYCIPHAAKDAAGVWQGMVAKVIVKKGAGTGGGADDADAPGAARAVGTQEIGRRADDVPPAVGGREARHLEFNLTSKEVVAKMADGTTYAYWTFDGTVPGPMLRARVGDTVTVNLHNDASSVMGHDIDFHAVTGPGGGAKVLGALPGETATATFKLLNPGLFVYHCAYQDPPLHVAHGMYGMILVEPEGGLPPVDKEFYVVQGDFYSPFSAGQKGHHEYDGDRAASEDPSFVVFNGRMASLQEERRLEADVGDRVRLFVGNGGPNLVSSFHVIGEVFDRSYDQASLTSAPQENVQTTLVPAGGAAMVEFDVEVPGDYYLVDHSLFRVHKGAFGVLHVEGQEDASVYRSGP